MRDVFSRARSLLDKLGSDVEDVSLDLNAASRQREEQGPPVPENSFPAPDITPDPIEPFVRDFNGVNEDKPLTDTEKDFVRSWANGSPIGKEDKKQFQRVIWHAFKGKVPAEYQPDQPEDQGILNPTGNPVADWARSAVKVGEEAGAEAGHQLGLSARDLYRMLLQAPSQAAIAGLASVERKGPTLEALKRANEAGNAAMTSGESLGSEAVQQTFGSGAANVAELYADPLVGTEAFKLALESRGLTMKMLAEMAPEAAKEVIGEVVNAAKNPVAKGEAGFFGPKPSPVARGRMAYEAEQAKKLDVKIPESVTGDVEAAVQKASLEEPSPSPKLTKPEEAGLNEYLLNAEGTTGKEKGLLIPEKGAPSQVDLADIIKEPDPVKRQYLKIADNQLFEKMRPNTVQDLQKAAFLAKDEDPLAVRLGLKPKGYENDLLKQAKSVLDKPESMPIPMKELGSPVASKSQVMSNAWESAKKNIVSLHPIRAIEDVWSAAGGKPAWDSLVSGLKKITPLRVQRGLLGSAGLEPENFLAYKASQEAETQVVADMSGMIAEALSKDVTPEETHILEGLLRGRIDPKHLQPTGRNIQLLTKFADVRETLDHIGHAAVEMDLLKNEAFQQGLGQYLPQLYRGTELESGWSKLGKFFRSPVKTVGERFKQRKIDWSKLGLTPEGRMKMAEMGAIENPAYSAAKASLDVGLDLANARMARRVAGDATMASKTPVTGGAEGEWVKMPSNKAYGDLADMYVHPDVATQIQMMRSWATKSQALKYYDQMLGIWKAGKTAYNPGTWARNAFTNAWFFEGATGRSWLDPRQWKWFGKGLGEYAGKGDQALVREAERRNLFGLGNSATDTKDMLRKMLAESEGVSDEGLFQKIVKSPLRGYRKMDDVNRYLLFKHAVEGEGMTLDAAAAFAKKHGIDYTAIGPWVQNASRVVPFIKYPFKAFPLVAEYLLKRPLTMAKYPAILASMAYYAKKRAGWTKEDDDKAKAILDKSWMGSRRLWQIPYRDKDNRVQYLDTSFFLDSDIDPLSGPITIPFEMAVNKDHFTGREIYSKADEASGRKWFKLSDFAFKKLMPSLTPGPGAFTDTQNAFTPTGGYSADKIAAAIQGKADYLGRTRRMSAVLADVMMGLKIVPVDFAEQLSMQNRDIQSTLNDLKGQNRKFAKDAKFTDDEAEKIGAGDFSGFSGEKAVAAKNIKNNLDAMQRLSGQLKSLEALPGYKPEPAAAPEKAAPKIRKNSVSSRKADLLKALESGKR